jgi:8-oxo-dGTP pyrophosphatase MutT (NUDIX family)
MAPEAQAFLASHSPFDEERAVWGDGTMPLAIASYLGTRLPPLELVTSVRCIVRQGIAIVVLRNRDSVHIMPGGRREPGEPLEGTVRREVLEESGWTIANLRLLGLRHLRHLAPKPAGYRFPYPDFFWVIYAAEAAAFIPGARLADDYESEVQFKSFDEVRSLGLTSAELVYLGAALWDCEKAP